jgi:O-antigen/teichoic acid export membrane protein
VEQSLRALLLVAVPMVVGLAVWAGPLVTTVYGDRSQPAVPVLRLLALLGGIRVITGFFFDIAMATGRARRSMVAFACWLVVVAPALVVATRHWDDIVATAAAHVAVSVVVALPVYLWLTRQHLPSLVAFAPFLARLGLAAAVMVAIGLAAIAAIPVDVLTIVIGGGAALAAYAAIVLRAPGMRRVLLGHAGA